MSALMVMSLVLVLITAGLRLSVARAAPPFAPSISVSPSSGPPGSTVTLNGSGYTGGTQATIRWDGVDDETFTIPGGGSFSRSYTIPGGASVGNHTITVCTGCGQGEFEQIDSASFKVTAPATNTPVPPTSTFTPYPPTPTFTPHPPTPTFTPLPPTSTFTASPTSTSSVTVTPEEIEDRCGGLGLGPDAVVIDFEQDPRWYEGTILSEYGVSFKRSSDIAVDIGVSPHSPSQALESVASAEFGSILHPITMNFERPVVAVGMFVGLEEARYVDSEVTASLTVYGYQPGRSDVRVVGSDSTSFPPRATDIEHCLRVVPEEGTLISKAVLEYTDASGGSIAEQRLMDDLTLVYAGEEESFPPDQPPDLVIDRPPRDSYITDVTIPVRASVTEDRDLLNAYYRINGSSPTRVSILTVPGDPRQYRLAFNLSQGQLDPDRTNILTVGVQDSNFQNDEEEVLINVPTPEPELDVELVKFEAVQVVQCLNNPRCADNSVPLLAGKPTMVRAYVRVRSGSLSSPISGRLCKGDVESCTTAFVRPSNRITPDEDLNPVKNDRGDLNASLNFTLPASWIDTVGGGSLDLSLWVNYEGEGVPEVNYRNNRLHESFTVQEPRAMKVAFLRVKVDDVSPSLSERWDMADWLGRVFPVEGVEVVHPGDSGSILVDIAVNMDSLADSSGGGCGKDWGSLMSELETLYRINQDRTGSDAHYFGMVDRSLDRGGILGCGQTPGWASASIVTPGKRFGAEVAAQELAHNKGLGHAPGIPGSCMPDGIDESYPVDEGRLDAWGVDVTIPQAYKPEDSFDYMGYCGSENDTWTSEYTYMNMYGELPRAAVPIGGGHLAAESAQEKSQYLVGSGLISPEGIDLVTGFYELSLFSHDGTPPGPYTVKLLDESGGELYSRDFRATHLSNDHAENVGTFYLTLPVIEGTHEIVFFMGEREIERITASNSPPSIEITSPLGGESWGESGRQTIAWQANDPDGDALQYSVGLSGDGGKNWTTIAANHKQSELEIDSGDIGGGEVLVRIMATDGFHTATAVLGEPVTVPPKGPKVDISLPVDGKTFLTGETVHLKGQAIDLEDGVLEGDQLRWASDQDGDLGRGSSIDIDTLSAGGHTIFLRGKDEDGNLSSESVRITIQEHPFEAGEGSSTPSLMDRLRTANPIVLSAFLTAFVLLFLAGVGLLVFVVRKVGTE